MSDIESLKERLEKLKAERDQFMENACDAGQKMIILANHGDIALGLIPATLATITSLQSKLAEAERAWPRLTEPMIEAAAAAHYGKKRIAPVGGAHGVDMTVDGRCWTFADMMRRAWPAMKREYLATIREED